MSKVASGGVAEMRKQVRAALADAEVKMQVARSRAHIDGAAYASGQIDAYKFVLSILHS